MANLQKRGPIYLTELNFTDPTYKVGVEKVQLHNGDIEERKVKSGLAISVNHRLTKTNQMIRKKLIELKTERKIKCYFYCNNFYQWKLNGEGCQKIYNLKMIEKIFPKFAGKNYQIEYNDEISI